MLVQVLKHLAKEVKVVPSASLLEDGDSQQIPLPRIGPGGSSEKDLPHETYEYNLSSHPPPPMTVPQRLKLASHISLTPDKLSLSRSQPDLSRVSDLISCRAITTNPRYILLFRL